LLKRILIKGLALLYLAMAVIGFLGYYQIGDFPSKCFNFFLILFGPYAIVLPILCLIFTGICWYLSRKPKDEHPADDEEEDQVGDYSSRKKAVQREQNNQNNQNNRWNTPPTVPKPLERPKTRLNGFDDYFSGNPLIEESLPVNDNKYAKLGNNYSTYFGQGERNIFLPSKTVSVDGFKEYFQDANRTVSNYSRAVNDTVRQASCLDVQQTPRNAPPKPFFIPRYDSADSDSVDNLKQEAIKPENPEQIPPKTVLASDPPVRKPSARKWQLPGLELLRPPAKEDNIAEPHKAKLLEDVLSTFGVTAKVVNITVGPLIARYELSPAPGTKISKILNLADDIALALASRDIRIEAPIPGKAAVGIEIPRSHPRTVYFREVIDSDIFRNSQAKLSVALGKDIADDTVLCRLEKMPHLLVAGATGSGKSIFINCLINSLLYTTTPDEVRFLMIDPKMVELSQYNGIPHLLTPVVTDPKKANKYLRFIVREMENRYELFAANGVRDIEHYNKEAGEKPLPYIVVIIDELADLMMVASNEVEESVCRLAQMARAAGIHLVIATQRPSVNVITGLIKANIPSRISFAVSSQIDSRTILDTGGAEKLLGRGDMLYSPIGLNKPLRVHGCYIDEQEVKNVIAHWTAQGAAEYSLQKESIEESAESGKHEDDFDDRFAEAGELVISTGIASVSFLQRRLRVGYSRAARLMDMLEKAGVVGSYDGNKPRNILMSMETFRDNYGT